MSAFNTFARIVGGLWKGCRCASGTRLSRKCLSSTGCCAPVLKETEKAVTGTGCPLCQAGLDKFGYKDVLLLRQFISPKGYLLPRRYTGICPKMQRRIAASIKRSRKMGLLPNYKPEAEAGAAAGHGSS